MFAIVGSKEILVSLFMSICITPELILIQGLLDAHGLARHPVYDVIKIRLDNYVMTGFISLCLTLFCIV